MSDTEKKMISDYRTRKEKRKTVTVKYPGGYRKKVETGIKRFTAKYGEYAAFLMDCIVYAEAVVISAYTAIHHVKK